MENWKPIDGYPNYEVSDMGRVRSLPRRDSLNRYKEGKILKPCFDSRHHYLHVMLFKEGKSKPQNVHRLVALAFLPNPHNYKEVNHKDEDKTNNRVDNLEWCTHQYNNTYGSKLDSTRGVRNPMNKFSPSDVLFIKTNHIKNGGTMRTKDLAKKFNMSPSHVSSILYGRRWNHETSN